MRANTVIHEGISGPPRLGLPPVGADCHAEECDLVCAELQTEQGHAE